jgi:ketosteroid isomerase-like protein
MSEQNVERMGAAINAVNRRDAEALTTLLTKDAEIVPMRAAIEGTVFRGSDAVAQWYAALDESWEEMWAEIESVRDLGDRVLFLGRFRGRGRGSGAPIDVEAAGIAHFRDGLITRLQSFTNRAEALKAAGLSE